MDNEIPSSSGENQIRIAKVQDMKKLQIEAWPYNQEVNSTCKEAVDAFNETFDYKLAGRLITLREHGKTIFANIQDRSGKIQIYLRSDVLGEDKFKFIKDFIDIGDIIWVEGNLFKTRTGEITLKVHGLKLLSKSLHPLPDKFHGLADIEVKYRQRYLDLISDTESKERFIKRAKIVQSIRNYLNSNDFIEVETPMLHPIPGGAVARPFVTHHNALDMDLYLRIAPELYLKELVIGGLERVYEINRCFRNEGISTRHNPEFTTLEFYMAYQDYKFIMQFVEELLKKVVLESSNKLEVQFGEHVIDFSKPFEKISMFDAVVKYGGFKESDLTEKNIDNVISNKGLVCESKALGSKITLLFETFIESKLIQPTFITGYPVEVSPLAKRDPDNPSLTARFELFIAGMEIGNGFNELNDPFDQAERFKEQARARAAGDVEAHYYDADFVLALEHALPPTVGVGMGIDRITMILTNSLSIKDVILFPTLKRK